MVNKLIAFSAMLTERVGCMLFGRSSDENSSFIAMFHNVLRDDADDVKPYECRLGELVDFVDKMQAKGFEFVSLDALLTIPAEDAVKNKCVITFDDGFESLFTLASPALQERNIPFTVFVTASFIGESGYLNINQLKKLSELDVCTVGMHAFRHEMFRFKSRRDLAEDFYLCREELSEITGSTFMHYAFPYGSTYACSFANTRLVHSLGVKSISMTLPVRLNKLLLKYRFYLPRLDIPSWYHKY